MDVQANVYSEKKIASYETVYKENILSKPLDINLTVTAAHLYGIAFVCDRKGTKEGDPEYMRFVCDLGDITKVFVNNNNRNAPIYVQCDREVKGVYNSHKIILPNFNNTDEIVKLINSAKDDFDKKNVKKRPAVKTEEEKAKERERLRKAADDEFKQLTENYTELEKKKSAASAKATKVPEPEKAPVPEKKTKLSDDFIVADILGLDDFDSDMRADNPKTEKPDMEDAFEELVVPDIADLPDAESVENPGVIPNESFAEINLEEFKPKEIKKPEEAAQKPKAAPVPPKPAVHEAKSDFNSSGKMYSSMYSSQAKPEPKESPKEEKVKPAAAPKAEKKLEAPKIDLPESGKMSLEEFQTAVKKLKTMLDEGVLTDEEFANEKSKLLKFLY